MFKNCCKVLDFVQNVLQTMFNNFAQENVSNFSNCLICFSYFDQAFVFQGFSDVFQHLLNVNL